MPLELTTERSSDVFSVITAGVSSNKKECALQIDDSSVLNCFTYTKERGDGENVMALWGSIRLLSKTLYVIGTF